MADRTKGLASQEPTLLRRVLTQNSRAGNPKRTRPNCHLSPKRGTLEPAWIASIIRGGDPKTLLREREGTQGPWRRGAIRCCRLLRQMLLRYGWTVARVGPLRHLRLTPSQADRGVDGLVLCVAEGAR